MNDHQISIIVPVYKVEKYLPKCIDSILAQTYTNFELFLIDDGSPDKSGAICDEYATRDQRIRVYHKENGGVSSARNLGIELAQGKWIVFVDGDDWIGPEYIKSMLDNNGDADISMQGYDIIRHNGLNVIHKFDSTRLTNNILEVFSESEYKNIINSPISKLFKSSIIRQYNIKFVDKISYGEDHLFVLDYLIHVDSIFITDSFEYFYYQDDSSSLTRRYIPLNQLIDYMILSNKKQLNLVNQCNYKDNTTAKMAIAWRFYGLYTKLLYDFFNTSPSYVEYCKIIKTLRPYGMIKDSLNNKRRWLFRFIENAPLKVSYSIIKRLF